jgi:hypothetical protein
MEIDLNSELTFRNSFLFPLQNALARKEVIWGGLIILLPFIGWLLNMGHRIEMVHRMHQGKDAWPSWNNYARLLKSGTVTFLGMVYYYVPGAVSGFLGLIYGLKWLDVISAVLIAAATAAIPGYMTHYCLNYDAREIFNPLRALRRAAQGGQLYWKAWGIALTALLLSFFGLLLLGIGFLFTSVWFWQVAGFSFACVFTRRFSLIGPDTAATSVSCLD